MVRPEIIRRHVGVSRAAAARLTGCSLPTVRIYELDPSRIGPVKRPILDRVYQAFAALAASSVMGEVRVE